MGIFESYLTWTTLTSLLILAAAEQVDDVAKKNVPDIPVIFPLNTTASLSYKICWPNNTEMLIEFIHSRPNISKEMEKKLYLRETELGQRFSDYMAQIVSYIGEIRNLVNDDITNAEKLPVHPIRVPLCWPHITTAFWEKHLHSPKDSSLKHIKLLRSRYFELSRNFSLEMIQVIKTIDKLSDLTHYFFTEEKLLEAELRNSSEKFPAINVTEKPAIAEPYKSNSNERRATYDFQSSEKSVKKESFLKSAIVPILGVIILALFICNAVLYRKIHQRYWDQPLLHEEEIMSHFMRARNTRRTGQVLKEIQNNATE